jgi:hypothetical protein
MKAHYWKYATSSSIRESRVPPVKNTDAVQRVDLGRHRPTRRSRLLADVNVFAAEDEPQPPGEHAVGGDGRLDEHLTHDDGHVDEVRRHGQEDDITLVSVVKNVVGCQEMLRVVVGAARRQSADSSLRRRTALEFEEETPLRLLFAGTFVPRQDATVSHEALRVDRRWCGRSGGNCCCGRHGVAAMADAGRQRQVDVEQGTHYTGSETVNQLFDAVRLQRFRQAGCGAAIPELKQRYDSSSRSQERQAHAAM